MLQTPEDNPKQDVAPLLLSFGLSIPTTS